MVPNVELPPRMLFTVHVTAVLEVFVTVAVNCFVVLTRTLALVGEMLMPIALAGVAAEAAGVGFTTVTDALPTAAGDTTLLLAWTVTVPARAERCRPR